MPHSRPPPSIHTIALNLVNRGSVLVAVLISLLELAARFLEALKAEFDVEELPNEALVPIECHEAGIQVITVRVAGSQ